MIQIRTFRIYKACTLTVPYVIIGLDEGLSLFGRPVII